MKKSYVTVTDQFCGAGGSSLGATLAGAEVKLALNHWKLAVETHNTNFPTTDHDCTDISACDPRRYASTDILITSPECTNHSLAKGKKRKNQGQLSMFGDNQIDPAEERSRATMWDVPRFAEYHNYNLIIVENVPDAHHWIMYPAWLQAMHLLGYEHKEVFFNSMFAHPTPQSRDRMYIVFWKRGNKAPDLEFKPLAYCRKCAKDVASIQSWKNPLKKWGKYGKNRQYVYRCPVCALEVQPYYYAAANAIDWSLPAQRIGDRERPLKDKTLARIELGLKKFGGQSFLTFPNQTGDYRNRSVDGPFPTQTTTLNPALAIPPLIVDLGRTDAENNRSWPVNDKPLPTQTARQDKALVIPPYIIELNRTGTARPVSEALSTVLAGGNHHGLVLPWLMGNYTPGTHRPVTAPFGTITTQDHHSLVSAPFIVSYYGCDESHSIREAMGTLTTVDRHALVQPATVVAASDLPKVDDCYFRMLQPHEVGRAMAFPDSYKVLGNQREKVKQYGNAVTPPVMSQILERCLETFR